MAESKCPRCGKDEISQLMQGEAWVPCEIMEDGAVELYDSPGPNSTWEEVGLFLCEDCQHTFTL